MATPQPVLDSPAGSEFRDDVRRRQPLPPDVLKRLTTLDDKQAWRAAGLNLLAVAIILIPGSRALESLWLLPFVWLLMALAQQALFVLAHDAAHYRLFSSRALNDGVGRAVASVVGISMCSYRVVHRLHHNDLYGKTDPDTPLHGGYPRGRRYLFKKLARDLTGVTAPKTYGYFFGAPAIKTSADTQAQPLDDTSPALRAAARADRWWVVGFQLLAPVAAYAFGILTEYLVLWVLPLLTVLQAVLRLRAIMEHGAVTDYSSPLTAARTNLGPRWLMAVLFPHYVHYHVEHHLYPAIPHYHLRECHEELEARGWLQAAEVKAIGDTFTRVCADPACSFACEH
jgi:fatty acid desaturase